MAHPVVPLHPPRLPDCRIQRGQNQLLRPSLPPVHVHLRGVLRRVLHAGGRTGERFQRAERRTVAPQHREAARDACRRSRYHYLPLPSATTGEDPQAALRRGGCRQPGALPAHRQSLRTVTRHPAPPAGGLLLQADRYPAGGLGLHPKIACPEEPEYRKLDRRT